jgi:hypothetical protein
LNSNLGFKNKEKRNQEKKKGEKSGIKHTWASVANSAQYLTACSPRRSPSHTPTRADNSAPLPASLTRALSFLPAVAATRAPYVSSALWIVLACADSVRPPRQPYPRAWRAMSRDLLHARLSVHKDPRTALPVTRFSPCYPLARAHFPETRSTPPWGFRCAVGILLRCCGSALGVWLRGVANVRRSRPCQQLESCLMLCGELLVAVQTVHRAAPSQGEHWFVRHSRYAYLPRVRCACIRVFPQTP